MKKIREQLKTMVALVAFMLITTSCSAPVSSEQGETSSEAVNVESATADIMRLEEYGGDIEIINESGEEIEPTEGMKLQTGYQVKTASSAYAYISLDDSKAIKLDGLSESSIENDGKHLLITLTTGRLFFNVTEPLKADETMNIQTSNMITGIRGTSGYVIAEEAEDEYISSTTILSGLVAVNSKDKNNNLYPEAALEAGKIASYDSEDDYDHIAISEITEDDIPGFVKVVISEDAELQKDILEYNDFDMDEILEDAQEEWEEEKLEQINREESDDEDDNDNDDDNDDNDNDDSDNDDDSDDNDELDDLNEDDEDEIENSAPPSIQQENDDQQSNDDNDDNEIQQSNDDNDDETQQNENGNESEKVEENIDKREDEEDEEDERDEVEEDDE